MQEVLKLLVLQRVPVQRCKELYAAPHNDNKFDVHASEIRRPRHTGIARWLTLPRCRGVGKRDSSARYRSVGGSGQRNSGNTARGTRQRKLFSTLPHCTGQWTMDSVSIVPHLQGQCAVDLRLWPQILLNIIGDRRPSPGTAAPSVKIRRGLQSAFGVDHHVAAGLPSEAPSVLRIR